MNQDNSNHSAEVFKNPYILLCLQWDESLSSFEGYKVIDDIAESKSGRPLIIISTGFSDQAATFLEAKEYKGVLIQAIIAPGKDDFDKANIMNDIAECTSTLVIGNYLEAPPEGAGMYNCGEAELVKINQNWDGHNSYNIILEAKGRIIVLKAELTKLKKNYLILIISFMMMKIKYITTN